MTTSGKESSLNTGTNCTAFIPAVVLFLACTTAQAWGTAADTWAGKDKIKHAQYSCVFGAAASALVPESKWQAVGLAMLPGLAKEIHDHTIHDGSGFSHKDMAANFVGAYTCATVGNWAINYSGGKARVAYSKEF
jgi:uncharacterized protein YfiM (DUF2279 family)